MAITISPKNLRFTRKGAASRAVFWWGGAAALALATITGVQLLAQIEGDRGIAPLANSQDIQVNGISVDVTGKTGAEARIAGWKQAEKEAWKKLGGPDMPVESIDAMVTSVVIGHEQIGPKRYIATLGVIFDKAKAGQFVGAGAGTGPRSAPLLLIPVLDSGGVRQVFEVRGPWQRAWAEFQAAASPVDYVRPTGSGGESLILTAGQTSRRSRLWWRTVLGQFDASDVVMPVARLERQWPGGPIKGTFTARYGPDNTFLGSFTMDAASEQALPGMLEQAVGRIDGLYRDALATGELRPDPSINAGGAALDRAFAELREKLMPKGGEDSAPAAPQPTPTIRAEDVSGAPTEQVTVQFATPDAVAVDAALAAVRGVPGVQGAATVSLAIGGTSVMRVTVAGGGERLASALRGQGWKVSGGGTSLRISR
ncbi:heavy-metal-associated domain-containing protein [Novosphingobium kaempferiae]|uniref:heavy-metal-associated domain-containing protein n=1 Tax=Novosphingobium kaempferiae TaxID=2896849 RepID=UPI001E3F3F75|nr:heavy-metal-associated domain-containing protein [Novosphingobium kaempferiae]